MRLVVWDSGAEGERFDVEPRRYGAGWLEVACEASALFVRVSAPASRVIVS